MHLDDKIQADSYLETIKPGRKSKVHKAQEPQSLKVHPSGHSFLDLPSVSHKDDMAFGLLPKLMVQYIQARYQSQCHDNLQQ